MNSIVVFGRQPRPGWVKSRLANGIGDSRAARIYGRLLRHTLEQVVATNYSALLMLAEPPENGWLPAPIVDIEVQCAGHLGERMTDAFARRFDEGCTSVVLIGSDCPGLGCHHFGEAFDVLERRDAVLGPAADGGYWLIGLRRAIPALFEGIAWSEPTTLTETRDRLASRRASWDELEVLDDVDTIDDLKRIRHKRGGTPIHPGLLADLQLL